MEDERLKPCPFCGGKPEIDISLSRGKALVRCKCGGMLYKKQSDLEQMITEMIINAWNSRTTANTSSTAKKARENDER